MSEVTGRLTAALAGRYRLERELGQGGMATVYLAHDMKHDRKVALKVLRPELAAVIGAERFLQEIKVTANLQHPNILPLYDSGEAESFLYYVMPYVEGESLRDRINREKQLAVTDAVEIIRAVAAALDYAHRRKVIHRDIKPENILLHDGNPVVADFGIALAVSHAGGHRLTETGLSVGTPHYMSPEQAMGDRELDERSDIYSLGAMLYELLVGEPPFTGPTAQSIVAKVITERPAMVSTHRDTVPRHVSLAVYKALAKLPADRYPSAVSFGEALVRPQTADTDAYPLPPGETIAAPVKRWNALTIVLAVLLVLAAVLALWGWLRPTPPAPVSRFHIALPEDQLLQSGRGPRVAVSPDGMRFVYLGPGEGGGQLWVRERDQLSARPLRGTEGAISPFFAPDGRRVGFYTIAPMRLKTVSLGGEPPVTVADSGVDWDGGTWGPDGYIYSDSPDGLVRVAQGGGRVERMTRLDTARGESAHNYPDVLPGGKGALFTIVRGGVGDFEIGAVDLGTGGHHTVASGVYARYAAPGYLVYVTATGTLMAAPFDEPRLELTGEAVALAEGVGIRSFGYVDLGLSTTGTLIYASGGATATETDLVWVSRDGEAEVTDSNAYSSAPVISPDGRRVAVAVASLGDVQIWIRVMPDGPSSKLTFEGGENGRPFFSPDGRSVGFYTSRTRVRSLYAAPADGSGTAEPLLVRPQELWEGQWSRDGRWLVYRQFATPGADLMAVRTDGDTTPVTLVATRFNERAPALSPDGRWLAYVSDESGTNEVYVRPFPDAARAKWQVSLRGGTEPVWAHSGRELFYRTVGGDMVAAEITTTPTFAVGRQTVLFDGGAYVQDDAHREYDVAPDDRRFLMVRERGGGERTNLVVVDNWFRELLGKVER